MIEWKDPMKQLPLPGVIVLTWAENCDFPGEKSMYMSGIEPNNGGWMEWPGLSEWLQVDKWAYIVDPDGMYMGMYANAHEHNDKIRKARQ